MAMTKKDFIAMAAIVKREMENAERLKNATARNSAFLAAMGIAGGMADHFAAENPRFNRAQFLSACGL